MSARRKPGLYTDAIETIQAARRVDENTFMNMLRTYGELDQTTIGVLLGRSQSFVSRHLNGGAGLVKNREQQRERNRRTQSVKLDDAEIMVRLLAEKLAPMFTELTAAVKSVAVKLDAMNEIAKRK